MLHPAPKQLPLSHEATAIAVSLDGRRLAASSLANGRAVLYDLRFGRALFRFGVSATALAFSPDATRLVTASGDRRPPSSRTGRELAPVASGVVVNAEEHGQTVRVWDLVTGRCLAPEPWAGEAPIAISPDGALIAVAADRATSAVNLLRMDDGSLVRSLPLRDVHPLRSLAFSPDGQWLCATTGVSPAILWTTNDFRRGLPPGVREDDVAVAFCPRDTRIAVAGLDCRVRIVMPDVEASSNVVLAVQNGRNLLRGIEALELSPDGGIVIARGRTGAAQVFSTTLARPLWTASPGPLAFMPDGKTIAAWWCGAVWLRHAESGDVIVAGADEPSAGESSPDGQTSAPPSRPKTLRSGEVEGNVSLGSRAAPTITDAPPSSTSAATRAEAMELLARISTGWAESPYRKTALVSARDADGLGVRLPLRGGYAYVQIRPKRASIYVLVQVTADEPDLEPPPSSSLVRLSRWIRDRLSAEARRQAAADREWAAELVPDAREGDVRVERGPSSLTIHLERAALPTQTDLEALVHAAEQKLAC